MFFRKYLLSVLSLFLILSFVSTNSAQNTNGGTPSQRLDVMRQRLDTMRRSVNSALSALKDDSKGDKSKKDDKASLETPSARLKSLEKEISSATTEVNDLRGKVDRSEKYEMSDIEQLETTVSGLQQRVDNTLVETARERANNPNAPVVGSKREVKEKTKKLLWLIPIGKERDEYEELIGNVVPGRDRELFIVATREVRKNNYEVGRLLFQTIITTYPDSPYLPMAKLAIADSFFLEGSTSALIQAAAGYQDWLTFFPTHPLADRVMLKIAESEMRQIGLPDREITRAKRAEQRLKALLQQYPQTLLRPEAEKRLAEVQDNLGLHNLYIANYYYTLSVNQKKGGLKGAQSRYREIMDKYPKFSYMDEALYKIAVTYQIEEETDEAAKYFQRLIRDYPNSEFIEKAREQLQVMGATIPEPDPARKNVMPPKKEGFFDNFKNQFLGIYPLTIDKNGVLMTNDFDKAKFELIDQIIENQGDIAASQIPKALTTVIKNNQPQPQPQSQTTRQQQQPQSQK
jgi:outer membrane assembly lipoprotein YfiO